MDLFDYLKDIAKDEFTTTRIEDETYIFYSKTIKILKTQGKVKIIALK